MTLEDVRDALDGMSRRDIPSTALVRAMRAANIVAAYCPDDRRVWIFGAASGEIPIGKGAAVSAGEVRLSEADDAPGFLRALRNTVRDDVGPVRLSFETNAEHEVFSALEGDTLFSLGVIFSVQP